MRKIIIPFIFSIVTLIITLMLYYTTIMDIHLRYNFSLFLLTIVFISIPFILQIVTCILTNNHKGKEKIGFIMSIIIFLLTLLYFPIIISYIAYKESITPVTNYKSYGAVYKQNKELKFFPKEIPQNAQKVKYYYNTGMNYKVLNVSYIVDEKTIESLKNKYQKKALWIGNIDEIDKDFFKKNNITIGYHEILLDDVEITSDYQIYYLNGSCTESCQSAVYAYVAIYQNEVLLVYRSWS